jgi:hypothetical protein
MTRASKAGFEHAAFFLCMVLSWLVAFDVLGANPVPDKNARIPVRLEWNRKTLVATYDRMGKFSPKWDRAARQALELFAEMRSHYESVTEFPQPLLEAALAAVTNGCDDPMIRYIDARQKVRAHASRDELRAVYTRAAEAMERTPYCALRKFYAFYHASEYYDEVSAYQSKATDYLVEALADKTMPIEEVYDGTSKLLYRLRDRPGFKDFYDRAQPLLMTNWPTASETWLLKGLFYIHYAYQLVGEDENGPVMMAAGVPLIGQRLVEAQKALTNAWHINPNDARIARWMIAVELGQNIGRERMEMWFARAMKLDPNYYQACTAKLLYLQPQWRGSEDDMIEFGLQCVNTRSWGPTIPLILVDAHELLAKRLSADEQAQYWRRPEVWGDVKSAYAAVFARTNAVSYRQKFLEYAKRAGDEAELNRQQALIEEMKSGKRAHTGAK